MLPFLFTIFDLLTNTFCKGPPKVEATIQPENGESKPSPDNPTLKFTSVMNGLKLVYPKPIMDDISTSFCFISLLHLANEKGLVIEKTDDLSELNIRKDWTAEATEGD